MSIGIRIHKAMCEMLYTTLFARYSSSTSCTRECGVEGVRQGFPNSLEFMNPVTE